jgi:hypothetical protein
MATSDAAATDPTPDADDDDSTAGAAVEPEAGASKISTPARLFEPGSAPEMPQVQQHAIDAARGKKQTDKQASTSGSGIKDVDGRPFNPAHHVANPDGSPVMNKDGTCRKLGGRGAPKATGKGPAPTSTPHVSKVDIGGPQAGPMPDPAAAQIQQQIAMTSKISADLTFQLGMMLGGEEFRSQPGEPEAMEGAYLGVYTKYGVTDLPPLAVLAIVLVTYGGKRWHAPKVKARREGFKVWLWKWWNRKKIRQTEEAHRNAQLRDHPNQPPERMDILNGAAPAAH